MLTPDSSPTAPPASHSPVVVDPRDRGGVPRGEVHVMNIRDADRQAIQSRLRVEPTFIRFDEQRLVSVHAKPMAKGGEAFVYDEACTQGMAPHRNHSVLRVPHRPLPGVASAADWTRHVAALQTHHERLAVTVGDIVPEFRGVYVNPKVRVAVRAEGAKHDYPLIATCHEQVLGSWNKPGVIGNRSAPGELAAVMTVGHAGVELAKAMRLMADKGLAHVDLSPGNIGVRRLQDGRAGMVLLDTDSLVSRDEARGMHRSVLLAGVEAYEYLPLARTKLRMDARLANAPGNSLAGANVHRVAGSESNMVFAHSAALYSAAMRTMGYTGHDASPYYIPRPSAAIAAGDVGLAFSGAVVRASWRDPERNRQDSVVDGFPVAAYRLQKAVAGDVMAKGEADIIHRGLRGEIDSLKELHRSWSSARTDELQRGFKNPLMHGEIPRSLNLYAMDAFTAMDDVRRSWRMGRRG